MIQVIYRPTESVGFDAGNNRPYLVGGHWLATATIDDKTMISATAKTKKTACAKLAIISTEHALKTGNSMSTADNEFLSFLAKGYEGYGIGDRRPPESAFDLDLDDCGD